jgi:hypothetical protein
MSSIKSTQLEGHIDESFINLPYVFCSQEFVKILVPTPKGADAVCIPHTAVTKPGYTVKIKLPQEHHHGTELHEFTKPGSTTQICVTTEVLPYGSEDGGGDPPIKGRGTVSLPDSTGNW